MPVEPEPTRWRLPSPSRLGRGELVTVGADLAPGTLLAAYRGGLFPMPVNGPNGTDGTDGTVGWWSPDPRGVIPLDGLRVSRSLRRSLRRYSVRVDTAFEEVVAACARRSRPEAWITPDIGAAYGRLHRLGWAHSVEAWTPQGHLAGGLYGVAIGGLFAGESMFSVATDASKVALVRLVELLAADGASGRLLDVQWCTEHLASLGCVSVARRRYLRALQRALALPLPPAFDDRAR